MHGNLAEEVNITNYEGLFLLYLTASSAKTIFVVCFFKVAIAFL